MQYNGNRFSSPYFFQNAHESIVDTVRMDALAIKAG